MICYIDMVKSVVVILVTVKLVASCRTLFRTFFTTSSLSACEKGWIWDIYINLNLTLTPEISIPAFFFFRITEWVNGHQSWREKNNKLVSSKAFVFNLECRIDIVKKKMFGSVVLAWFDGLNSSAQCLYDILSVHTDMRILGVFCLGFFCVCVEIGFRCKMHYEV